MKIKAKKSLGQNFLKSKNALLAIIKAGQVSKEDIVLEVGPGRGFLTEKLLTEAKKVIAVEKDDKLIEFLKDKFLKEIASESFELIHGDILETDLFSNKSLSRKYKLIANIPYYITGIFLRKFLSCEKQPEKMVIMVQKEIADRIVAMDKKESLLSISVKAYGKPLKIMKVSKENFNPRPKVDSAILFIDNISKDLFKEFAEKEFFEVVKAGFAHKRKKVVGNLKDYFKDKLDIDFDLVFSSLNLDKNARAEDLSLENWKNLVINILDHKTEN